MNAKCPKTSNNKIPRQSFTLETLIQVQVTQGKSNIFTLDDLNISHDKPSSKGEVLNVNIT